MGCKSTDRTGRAFALTAVLIANTIASFSVSSVNILLPEFMISLGEGFGAAQWIAISYVVALGPAVLIGGRLCDLYGKPRMFMLGIIIFTVAAGVCALAYNAITLAACRAAQGVGAGILVATNLALVRDIMPLKHIGAGVGMLGSSAAIGTALGPVLGGVLTDVFHWRIVFLLNVPLGVAALFLAAAFLRNSPHEIVEDRQFAWADAATLSIAMVILAISLRLFGVAHFFGSLTMCAFSIMLLALVFLRRTIGPRLVSIEHLRSSTLQIDLITNMIVASIVMGSLIVGPFYLMQGLGSSIRTVGFVMATSPVVVAVTSITVGRRLSQSNAKQVTFAGLILLGFGVIGMSCLDRSMGIEGYVVCLALTASGYGIFTSANNTGIMGHTSTNDSGSVSGVLNFSRCLGLLIGTTLLGSLFERVTGFGTVQKLGHEQAERGLNSVYALAAILVAAAIMLRLLHSRAGRSNDFR